MKEKKPKDHKHARTWLDFKTRGSSWIVPKNLPRHLVLSSKKEKAAHKQTIAMNINLVLAMEDDAWHYLLSLRGVLNGYFFPTTQFS
jgi:hypothetical protein